MFIFYFYRVIILIGDILMSNKEKKKKLKKIESSSTGENDEIIRMFKVLGIVVLTLVIFYFAFAIYNGEISFGKKDDEESSNVEIQNIEIVAGSTFNRVDDEYLVLFYEFDGDYDVNAISFYNLYSAKENHLKLYVVNLASAFNSNYVVTNRNEVNTSNAQNLKVMDLTLVRVKGGKAIATYAGLDEFNSYADTLLK